MKKNNQYLENFVSSLVYVALVVILSVYAYFHQELLRISLFEFFILGLAIFRLTWLFIYDSVMNFLRDYLNNLKNSVGRTISSILSCPWCTGIWVSLLVVAIYLLGPIGEVFILIIALAGLASIIHSLTRLTWKKLDLLD